MKMVVRNRNLSRVTLNKEIMVSSEIYIQRSVTIFLKPIFHGGFNGNVSKMFLEHLSVSRDTTDPLDFTWKTAQKQTEKIDVRL